MTVNIQIKQAEKLIKDIEKKINNWNERSMFTLKGVKNLSRSDLDSIDMYSKHFIRNAGNGFYGLMNPSGSIEEVLHKYDIL